MPGELRRLATLRMVGALPKTRASSSPALNQAQSETGSELEDATGAAADPVPIAMQVFTGAGSRLDNSVGGGRPVIPLRVEP